MRPLFDRSIRVSGRKGVYSTVALGAAALGLAAYVWWNTNWGLYLFKGRVLVHLSDRALAEGNQERADELMLRLLAAKPGGAIAESEVLRLGDRVRRRRLWLQLERLSQFEEQRLRYGRRAAEDEAGGGASGGR